MARHKKAQPNIKKREREVGSQRVLKNREGEVMRETEEEEGSKGKKGSLRGRK